MEERSLYVESGSMATGVYQAVESQIELLKDNDPKEWASEIAELERFLVLNDWARDASVLEKRSKHIS